MPDAAGALTHLARALVALGSLGGLALRVWRFDGRRLRPLAGPAPPDGWAPALDGAPGERSGEGEGAGRAGGRRADTPEGPAWFEPVRDAEGVWLEVREGGRGKGEGAPPPPHAAELADVVGSLLAAEKETAQVAAELSERYEEIDLVYTISEILGHTIRLDEAATRILQEVSNVVRARRATLLVADEDRRVLRLVAARGMDAEDVEPLEVDDPVSVAARVFREQRIMAYDPTGPGPAPPAFPEERKYRGRAFLSVPVMYAAPGGPPRAIGVINLTDRLGEDAFSAGDRKLVAAIANQIGAAVENARLVARDVARQSVQRELELAHDLQLRLLPSPLVIAARCDVAARCRPAESVGGDFYNLLNLREGRVGAMIGDVSSHGFGAALIMALVISASGIHAEAVETPSEVLRLLEESLAGELARTEMFLTLAYTIIDPAARRLTYASAGHQHAWVVAGDSGDATRLLATRPPLGLGKAPGADATREWRSKQDILCLFTDGIAEAVSASGERYGEERILGHVRRLRDRPAREILEAIFTDLGAFTDGAAAEDDRTLVLVRT